MVWNNLTYSYGKHLWCLHGNESFVKNWLVQYVCIAWHNFLLFWFGIMKSSQYITDITNTTSVKFHSFKRLTICCVTVPKTVECMPLPLPSSAALWIYPVCLHSSFQIPGLIPSLDWLLQGFWFANADGVLSLSLTRMRVCVRACTHTPLSISSPTLRVHILAITVLLFVCLLFQLRTDKFVPCNSLTTLRVAKGLCNVFWRSWVGGVLKRYTGVKAGFNPGAIKNHWRI